MITEEMLRRAATKASEALVAYYEKDYDPQNSLSLLRSLESASKI